MDIGTLDTIILAMPNSWKGTIFQYLGRIQRNLDKKSELRVYDYVDMLIPSFAKMYQKRKSAYKDLGYKIQEDKNSRRPNVDLYEGSYQSAILKSLKDSTEVMIAASFMSPFIFWKIINSLKSEYKIVLGEISDFYAKKLKSYSISYTLSVDNMPECILIDNRELWLCSDKGFNSDKGIAVCITSSDTINGFRRIIQQKE